MIDPEEGFGLFRSMIRHRAYVAEAVGFVSNELRRRVEVHDLSKLQDDEFAGFCRINAAARVNKFGSPEYTEGMKREKPTIDLHFSRNRHHSERPRLVSGIDTEPDDYAYAVALAKAQMTFIDVIEMVCDWWAARAGYDDPRSWEDTVKLNIENKGHFLSPEQLWLVSSVASFLGGVR